MKSANDRDWSAAGAQPYRAPVGQRRESYLAIASPFSFSGRPDPSAASQANHSRGLSRGQETANSIGPWFWGHSLASARTEDPVPPERSRSSIPIPMKSERTNLDR